MTFFLTIWFIGFAQPTIEKFDTYSECRARLFKIEHASPFAPPVTSVSDCTFGKVM